MNAVARLCLSALLFSCVSAYAIGPTIGGPTVGLWYNPQESGRGFNIDLQGDTMIVTTFIYQPSGDPIWYLSSGTYSHATGVFHSSYDSYSDGQCFGCPPGSPIAHSGAGGAMTITFHNDQAATLSYPGGSTNIVKFNYGFASALDNLYGEWALSYDIAGLVGGDWIIFDAPFTASDGTVYASGHMDLASQYLALGTFSSSLNAFVILVSIGNFEDFYQIGMDDRRGLGAAWVLSSGGTPSGNGSAASAGRLLYKSELIGAAAARQTKSTVQFDRSPFAQRDTSGVVDPETAAAIAQLRHALMEKSAD
jgi:hypothetical protein